MRIKEVMTQNVASCGPDANVATAAGLMWQYDCGVIPVLDEKRVVVGVITDRDICMALAMNNRLASDVSVGEVMSKEVCVCSPESQVTEVLATMKRGQILRVPVTSKDGTLEGIVSLSDLVKRADDARGAAKSKTRMSRLSKREKP